MKFSLRRIIINILPLFIIKFLAPYISTLDNIGDNIYYRLYDAKKPQKGAGLLIRKND